MSRPDRRQVLQFMVGLAAMLATRTAHASSQTNLRMQVAADQDLPLVLKMAKKLLSGGLSAGSSYPQVWIRDLNTYIDTSLSVNRPALLRDALRTFLQFQGPAGDVVDGYVSNTVSLEPAYRTLPALPGLLAFKNTVETDQESSLVLAVVKYVRATSDSAFLDEKVEGKSVRDRLELALEYPLKMRFAPAYGLIWGGTTIDWGDVAPERMPGTKLFPESHKAIGIYTNALFVCAVRDFLTLPGLSNQTHTKWTKVLREMKVNTHRHLWDATRKKYLPHLYLDGSPFPSTFNEDEIYLHGGTAVAIEADLLVPAEVRYALGRMRENVVKAHASSIGLTIYPTYPDGFYADPILTKPYTYQNGGDWCWFGGRMVQQLIRFGMVEDAYRELRPMLARVVRTGNFYEWWTPDNQPRGAADFRGGAGVLGTSIVMLLKAVNLPA